jgi:thiamine-monophosphate kinase
MLENKSPARTSLDSLGEFQLIEQLTQAFELQNSSSKLGIGDDAAICDYSDGTTVVTTDLLVEGIHFDLSYMPLKHLGYKAIVVNLSDVYAMNAVPSQITVSIAVSNRFTLEALEELYAGIHLACRNYKVDLVGGDTTSSTSGMTLSITAIGQAAEDRIVKRNGAQANDLLVVSGDLGGAYAGLQILEREKAVFKVNPKSQPDLSSYTYSIERQLKPEARKDVIELLEEWELVPNAMIDISDGLSSEIRHLSKQSQLGCNLYEQKLPIDPEVISICDEFNLNSSMVVLNGGEDYELLMAVPQSAYDKVKNHPWLSIIGHFTDKQEACYLINGLEQAIPLEAQGWNSFTKD